MSRWWSHILFPLGVLYCICILTKNYLGLHASINSVIIVSTWSLQLILAGGYPEPAGEQRYRLNFNYFFKSENDFTQHKNSLLAVSVYFSSNIPKIQLLSK